MGGAANTNAVRHGATSEGLIRPLARNHRRRVLRQLGLRATDLDPLARGYLDLYVRSVSKVDLLDAWFEEHGALRADGEPQPGMRVYLAAVNSARLALGRLEQHVTARRGDPAEALDRWLDGLPDDEDDDAPAA